MTGVTMMPWPPTGEPTASLKGCKPNTVPVDVETEFTISVSGFDAASQVAFVVRSDASLVVHASRVECVDATTLKATATLAHGGEYDVFVRSGADHAKGDNFVTATSGGMA